MVKIDYELNEEGVYHLLEAFLSQCRRDYLYGDSEKPYQSERCIEKSLSMIFGERSEIMITELRRQKKEYTGKHHKIYNMVVVKDRAGK